MTLKPKELDIPQNDPFKNCKLGRQKEANILNSIIQNYKEGFVMSVNGKWGSGKTTFIRMWSAQLETEQLGYKVLNFNAWKNDFESDIMVALISELKEKLGDDEIFKEALKSLWPLVRAGAKGLFKTLVRKHVGDEFAEMVGDGSIDGYAELFSKELEAYEKKKDGIVKFKASLEKYISIKSPDKPVIFFVDELDRCRPNYAVEVLEMIKHLFSVKGLIFVLSIDKEHLGHSICGVYGSENINSTEYLRRFIDIEYSLAAGNPVALIEQSLESFEIGEFYEIGKQQDIDYSPVSLSFCFESLVEALEITPRQQFQIFSRFKLVSLSFINRGWISPFSVLFFISLKECDPILYGKIKSNTISDNDFIEVTLRMFPPNKENATRNDYLSYFSSILLILFECNKKGGGINIEGIRLKIDAIDLMAEHKNHLQKSLDDGTLKYIQRHLTRGNSLTSIFENIEFGNAIHFFNEDAIGT